MKLLSVKPLLTCFSLGTKIENDKSNLIQIKVICASYLVNYSIVIFHMFLIYQVAMIKLNQIRTSATSFQLK